VRPGIAAAALLAFIFAWNNYVFPLILTDSAATPVTVAVLPWPVLTGLAWWQLRRAEDAETVRDDGTRAGDAP